MAWKGMRIYAVSRIEVNARFVLNIEWYEILRGSSRVPECLAVDGSDVGFMKLSFLNKWTAPTAHPTTTLTLTTIPTATLTTRRLTKFVLSLIRNPPLLISKCQPQILRLSLSLYSLVEQLYPSTEDYMIDDWSCRIKHSMREASITIHLHRAFGYLKVDQQPG
jgi:hypothetical protein